VIILDAIEDDVGLAVFLAISGSCRVDLASWNR
jgi:hypothetical protein